VNRLEVRDIVSGYGGTDVLREVSVSLEPGERVAVLGPNGAGKSTLLRTISGQLRVRAGSRFKDGEDVSNWRAHKMARGGVRWVGEPRPIFPSLTTEENLAVGGITRRDTITEQRQKVYELLPALVEKRLDTADSLSGGQQQMLAIGQALMTAPRYLCLDEPSLGLAPQVVTMVAGLIDTLASQGVGILWAEQFPEIALQHCSRVVLLSAGRVIHAGPAADFDRALLEAAYLGKAAAA
jgi:branched-chain amino acid transport system ATP-binding protein